MNSALLIYPHQLFEKNELLEKVDEVYLIEDPLFFGDKRYPLDFHKFKLVLHRASMRKYWEKLRIADYELKINYIEYKDELSKTQELFKSLKNKNIKKVFVYDPVDFILEKRLKRYSRKNQIELEIVETPYFVNTNEENADFFSSRKKFRMSDFYTWQRTRFKILIDNAGFPEGGRWSFDTENRKKLPKNIEIPELPKFHEDEYIVEAKGYVQKHFPNNPGDLSTHFPYPTDHKQAKTFLHEFIKYKLENFGPYEDAITNSDNYLFHSVLSSSINIGLLNPKEVINEVIKFYRQKSKDKGQESDHAKILASVEGFIRQILGWREFMRAVYVLKGVEIRNSNFFKHKKKLSKAWYEGNLGVETVDNIIKKVNKLAYSHHIERLMIMGNFMLLCELDPSEIYKWFMEMYIDAYDWVMVPNVYSMSQYADGGLITTKPYFSGSNYILKMSGYKKGNWSKIWDALFWNFVEKNQEFLSKNPRIGLMVKQFEKKSEREKKEIKKIAKGFLEVL